jgi:hypothetical protein
VTIDLVLPHRGHRLDRFRHRQERIVEEIQRNRRGEYRIPTWVLVVILLALVGGWIALIVLT